MATKMPQQAKGRMTARRSSISRGREGSGGGCAVCDAGKQFFLGGKQRRRRVLLHRVRAPELGPEAKLLSQNSSKPNRMQDSPFVTLVIVTLISSTVKLRTLSS